MIYLLLSKIMILNVYTVKTLQHTDKLFSQFALGKSLYQTTVIE